MGMILNRFKLQDGSAGLKRLMTVVACISMFILSGCKGDKIEINASSSAEEVYQAYCASCHEGGFKGWMTGAPTTGDVDAWKPRIEKGLEAMILSTVNGMGKMPAKGSCKTCSDEQVSQAVMLMAEQARKKL